MFFAKGFAIKAVDQLVGSFYFIYMHCFGEGIVIPKQHSNV